MVEDILDYVIVAGNPAKVIGSIGQCDVLLEFDGRIAKCNLCGLSLRDDGGDVSSL